MVAREVTKTLKERNPSLSKENKDPKSVEWILLVLFLSLSSHCLAVYADTVMRRTWQTKETRAPVFLCSVVNQKGRTVEARRH